MPRLPRVTADEVLRALSRDGWYIDRQGGHVILAHPRKAGTVVVPRHKGRTLRLGTLSQIIDAAGLTIDEFKECCEGGRMRRYSVILTPEEGGYVVTVPSLPGCVTEGDTHAEALDNARDAIALYVESLVARGLPVPEESVSPRGELVEVA